MRIAIASSGLGHVARGIETWAADSAAALARVQGSGFRVQAEGCRLKAEGQPSFDRDGVSAVPGGTDHRVECAGTIEVTLFAGAPLEGGRRRTEDRRQRAEGGNLKPESDDRRQRLRVVALNCWKRSGRLAHGLARWSPGFAWRWGLKNPYGWEQFSFWLRLWPRLVRGRFDILHVQDPMVADWCRRFRKMGLVKTKEILAHGTEEPLEFLERFEYVQHLAPWHRGQAVGCRLKAVGEEIREAEGCRLKAEGEIGDAAGDGGTTSVRKDGAEQCVAAAVLGGRHRGRRIWRAIPNFVDCAVFRPAINADERLAARRDLGIPEGAFVVGCVAAVKKDHKRIDCLIREVSGFRVQGSGCRDDLTPNRQHPTPRDAGQALGSPKMGSNAKEGGHLPPPTSHLSPATCHLSPPTSHLPPIFLLLAGARTDETPELQAMAERLLPGRHRMLLDCPRDQMPDVYRAMDVFVLPSLFEMMPIALLEAMASGLPCLVNRHPVLEWMIGAGGRWEVGGGRWEDEERPGSAINVCLPLNSQAFTLNPEPLLSTSHPSPNTCHLSAAAGLAIDMSREGEMASVLTSLTPERLAAQGMAARQQVERVFSKEVVILQYGDYYRQVLGER